MREMVPSPKAMIWRAAGKRALKPIGLLRSRGFTRTEPVRAMVAQMPKPIERMWINQVSISHTQALREETFRMSLVKVMVKAKIPVERVISWVARSRANWKPILTCSSIAAPTEFRVGKDTVWQGEAPRAGQR